MAVKATEGVLRQATAWRERAEARRAEIRAEYERITERINDTHLVFRARAGETGRLYGSVTMIDVADRLNEELGTNIDRRKFDSQPLRDLGEHRVTIHLDRDFHPQLLIYIHPEGAETEEADEAAQETAGAEMEAEAGAEMEAEAGAEMEAEAEAEVEVAEASEAAEAETEA
jgi:large subunit ribosomal protein L9